MSWPTSAEINEAVQNPQLSFQDPDLAGGTAEIDGMGIPLARSGSNADVYCFTCGADKVAVKCFTRQIAHLEHRYEAIHGALSSLRLPFTVDCGYQAKGIWLQEKWYPLVRMQWVDGIRLNEFAKSIAGRKEMLNALIQILSKMGDWLEANHLGHCDLQHGNILLIPSQGGKKLALRLVDYDGMWVPALDGDPPGEFGHPDYQHPTRASKGYYGPAADRFSLLAIATGLRGLMALGAEAWARYDNTVNMLFTQQDYAAPSRSPLFAELGRSKDDVVRRLVDALGEACTSSLVRVRPLSEVLSGKAVVDPGYEIVAEEVEVLPFTDDDELATRPADEVSKLVIPALVETDDGSQARRRSRARRQREKTTRWNKWLLAGIPWVILLFSALVLWAAGAFRGKPPLIAPEAETRDGPQAVIENPSFEAGTDGWEVNAYGAKPDIAADTKTVKAGKCSLRIAATEPSDTALGQEVRLKGGQYYRLSGWVRTQKLDPHDAPVCGTFQIQNPGGRGVIASGVNHSGDTEWVRETLYFEAPADGSVRIAVFFVGFGKGTGVAWFDDLKLEEADPATRRSSDNAFVSLFNGKDLNGWRYNPAIWKIDSGVILGTAQAQKYSSSLATERMYKDFHLRLRTKFSVGLNSAVFFGSAWDLIIGDTTPEGSQRNGDIQHGTNLVSKARATNRRPSEWFVLDLIVKGRQVMVLIDHVEVVNGRLDDRVKPNPIMLVCRPNSSVSFKDIEIKELKNSDLEKSESGLAAFRRDPKKFLTDTSWTMARNINGDRQIFVSLTLQANGRLLGARDPNESSWRVDGSSLVFLDAQGKPTTTFNRIAVEDGRLIITGMFKDGKGVHELIQEFE